MQNILYASAVRSLIYAQVCTCRILHTLLDARDIYLSNLGMDHLKATKCVMWYLQRTKDYKLIYRRSDQLEIIDYFDYDLIECQENRRSTSDYIFLFVGGVVSLKSVK